MRKEFELVLLVFKDNKVCLSLQDAALSFWNQSWLIKGANKKGIVEEEVLKALA